MALLATSSVQSGSSHNSVVSATSYAEGELYQCEGSNDCTVQMVMRNGRFKGENMLYFCKLCAPSIRCCEDCGRHMHRNNRKGHSFSPAASHVVSLPHLLSKGVDSNIIERCKEKIESLIGAEAFDRLSNTLYKCSSFSACGSVTTAAIVMRSLDLVTAASRLSVIPCVAVGGVHFMYYGTMWVCGRITTREFFRLAGRTVTETAVLAGATLGGAKIGAVIGTAAMPGVGTAIGLVAGIIIGAVAGWGWRKLYDKFIPSEDRKRRNARMQAMREALDYFDFKAKDCRNPSVFNKREIQRRFRRRALDCHPDTNHGNEEKWFELSTHYGILLAMLDKKLYEDKQIMKEICK